MINVKHESWNYMMKRKHNKYIKIYLSTNLYACDSRFYAYENLTL